MSVRLTDDHFAHFLEHGYVVVENYFQGDQLRDMQAALRRMLPPWEELKHDPPESRIASTVFPYAEQVLNRAIVDHEAIAFAKRVLEVDRVHYRPGIAIVNYPGHRTGGFHVDDGNNSLLPPTSQRRGYAQVHFWFYMSDVEADQAPTRVIPTQHGSDESKAVTVTAPAGSVVIFDNYTIHSGSDYTRGDGERYIFRFGFGRIDHYWEGVLHYTQVRQNAGFRAFIGELSAADRTLFRFPPPGHPYYTAEALAALEEIYPGWNVRGEYSPNDE